MTPGKFPIHLRRARKKAVEIINDNIKVGALLDAAKEKADRHKEQVEGFWGQLYSLVRLMNAWFRGEYKVIPVGSVLTVAAAIIYFVNPFDLVPDFIPVVGYLDDASVIAFVLKSLGSDIEKFIDWEQHRSVAN